MGRRTARLLFAGAMASGVFAQEPLLERTFFLTNVTGQQEYQELATVVRSIGDVRQLYVNVEQKSLSLRETAGQAAITEWLLNELDKPANARSSTSPGRGMLPHELRIPGRSDDLARIYYVREAATPEGLQELATLVRSIGGMARLFVYHPQQAIVLRGAPEQIALAEWLFREFDRPPAGVPVNEAPHEYRIPGASGDFVRAFYLSDRATPRDLADANAAIRSATNLRTVFAITAHRAVVVRGAAGQIAAAADAIHNPRD